MELEQKNYELCGIINHIGNVQKGHYVACCQNKMYKKWYVFDDEVVKIIGKSEVCSKNAYILFYIINDDI